MYRYRVKVPGAHDAVRRVESRVGTARACAMSAATVVRMVLHDVDAACARGIVHDGACVLELSATDMWMEHRGWGYQDITEEPCPSCGKEVLPEDEQYFVCAFDPRIVHGRCEPPPCANGPACPACGDAS